MLRVLKEREVMVKSDSPWLARLKYCFQSDTHLYMAMEYIPGGDMKNLLDHVGVLPEENARFYFAEMLLAVADLHKLGYIHRDLKVRDRPSLLSPFVLPSFFILPFFLPSLLSFLSFFLPFFLSYSSPPPDFLVDLVLIACVAG